jgi:hypothetical protein
VQFLCPAFSPQRETISGRRRAIISLKMNVMVFAATTDMIKNKMSVLRQNSNLKTMTMIMRKLNHEGMILK